MWRRDRPVLEAIARLDATIERARVSYESQLQITREVIRRNELAFQENSVIDRLEGGSAPATS